MGFFEDNAHLFEPTKTDSLTTAKENKLITLGQKKANIIGLADADTFTVEGIGSVRETPASGMRYDAAELPHEGTNFAESKSPYAMQKQKEQAGAFLNKPWYEVTDEDLYSVGNYQQIQKLAALVGEKDWKPTYVALTEPGQVADLTGKVAPLNIQADVNIHGTDKYGRYLGDLGQITEDAARDPLQNAFANVQPKKSDTLSRILGGVSDEEIAQTTAKLDSEGQNELEKGAKAFGYRALGGIASTLDLIPEVGQYLYAKASGDKDFKWSDAKGLYTKETDKKLKDTIGYNDYDMQQLGAQAQEAVKDAWDKGEYGKVVNVLGDAITSGAFAGETLGFLASLVLPGTAAIKGVQTAAGITKAAKALKAEAKALKAADKSLTTAQAIKKAEETAGVGYKLSKVLAGQTGQIGYAEGVARDAEAEYEKTYNEKMTPERRAEAFLWGLVSANLDAGMGKAILYGKDAVSVATRKALVNMPSAARNGALKKIAKKTGIALSRVIGVMLEEGATEGIQSGVEKIAAQRKDGEVSIGDVLSNKENLIGMGSEALLGAAGGIQLNVPSMARDAVATTTALAKEKLQQEQQVPKQTAEPKVRSVVENMTPEQREQFVAKVYSAELNEDPTGMAEVVNIATKELRGKEEPLTVLGADKSDAENLTSIADLVATLGGAEDINTEEIIETVSTKLPNLDKEAITQAVTLGAEEANSIRTMRSSKTTEEVGNEVVSGDKGYLTYYNAAKAALAAGNVADAEIFMGRMEKFQAIQEDKLAAIEAVEDEIVRDFNSEVDVLVGQGITRADAIRKTLMKFKSMKPRLVDYGKENKFSLKPETVLEKRMLPAAKREAFAGGAYSFINNIKKEVAAMQQLKNTVARRLPDITEEVKPGEPAVETEVPKAPEATPEVEEMTPPVMEDTEEYIPEDKSAFETKVPSIEDVETFEPEMDEVKEFVPELDEEVSTFEPEMDKTEFNPEMEDDVEYDPAMVWGQEYKSATTAESTDKVDTVRKAVKKQKDLRKEIDELEAKVQAGDTEAEIALAGKKEQLAELTANLKKATVFSNATLNSGVYRRLKSGKGTTAVAVDVALAKVGKLTVLNSINVKDIYSKAHLDTLVKAAEKLFIMPEYTSKGIISANDSVDAPGRVLLFNAKDKENPINLNALVAMDVAIQDYLVENAGDLITPVDMETIQERYSEDASEALYEALSTGGGLLKFEAEKLGGMVLENLGVVAADKATEIAFQELKASIGTMAMLQAVESGYIAEMREQKDKNGAVKASASRINWTVKENGKTINLTTILVKPGPKLVDSLGSIRAQSIQYGKDLELDTDRISTYSLSKPKKHKVNVHRQPYTDATREQAKVTNKMEAMPYTFNPGMDILEEMFKDEKGMDELAKLMGYVEIDEETMSYDTRVSTKARNAGILKNIEALLAARADVKNKSMYFKWFITKGGRMNMDSVTVNPQAEKEVHRWLITAEESKATLSKDAIDNVKVPEDQNFESEEWKAVGFMYGVAQAFGVDIDKLDTPSVLEEAKKILAKSDEELQQDIRNKNVDHVGHGLSALAAIRAYRSSDGSFDSYLTLEVDGLTNGFAFRVMQFPVSNPELWGPKVGVMTEGTSEYDIGSAADLKMRDGWTDTYQAQAVGIEISKEALEEYGEAFEVMNKYGLVDAIVKDGKVTKFGRDMLKQPTMVFNYSAGIEAIRRAVTRDLVDKMMDKFLSKDENGLYVMDEADLAKLVTNGEPFDAEAFRTALKEQGLYSAAMKGYRATLSTNVQELYGKAVTDVLEKNFKEQIQINKNINKAFQVMFDVFKAHLPKDMDKMNSAEKIEMIRETLKDVIPGIYGVDSISDEDILVVMGSGLATGSGTTQTKTLGGNLNTQTVVRIPTTPGAAGSVIPIHTADGATMMRTLFEKGFLGIHDAQVLGVAQLGAVYEYNKAWYDVNRSYSIIEEITKKLESIAENPKYADTFRKLSYTVGKKQVPASTYLSNLQSSAAKVSKARKEWFSKNLKIGQMLGPTGTMYEANTKEMDAIIASEKKNLVNKIKGYKVPDSIKLAEGLKKAQLQVAKLLKDC